MKVFQPFRLDTVNHCLWRAEERVRLPPRAFDVLRYLVEHAERLVTQDEILEALWPETYVNAEVIKQYIRGIRKALGDDPEKPSYIETFSRRGYQFIAPVSDESATPPPELGTQKDVVPGTASSEEEKSSPPQYLLKFTIIPILTVVAVAATADHFWFARSRATRSLLNANSIAVLPFVDMSPAKDQEYFSDGLSEQLIHDLAKVPRLKVVGRSSAFQFKGENVDLREVGQKLGVANVLEGSVRREGKHLRITAELVKADDGFQLWSQTYDREINDIFAVQDEIARAATDALQVKLLGTNGQPIPPDLRSANPEAYQAYLQANYFLGRGHNKEDLSKALAYADQAIKLDKRYAPAWALRAAVENRMAGFSLTDLTEGSRKARDDAGRAIELDPTWAPGYLALAGTQNDYDWDWNAANASLSKATALEPGSAEVIRLRSYLFRELGDLDQAIKLYEQAIALDPLRPDYHLGLGYLRYAAGQYDKAQPALQKALDLNPQAALVHVTLGQILIAKGKPEQALAEIQKEPNEWARLAGQGLVYHALGRQQDSNAALAELVAKYSTDSAFQIAEGYAFRGHTDESFSLLERAFKQRDGGLPDIKIDPLLKTLRHDPRYNELLKKMRL